MSPPPKNTYPKKTSRLWIALIILVTTFAHAKVVTGELVYRDAIGVGHESAGHVGVTEALRNAFEGIAAPETQTASAGWEVVPTLLRALSPSFGEYSIEALHALSLVVHILAALALLRFATTLGISPFASRAAALLFALHPVSVQSTAWISALASPLAGLLSLVALHHFERARANNELSILSGFAFLLALLSSSLALAAIPIALYLCWSPTNGDARRSASRALAPLFGALLAAWLLGSAAHGSLSAGFIGPLRDAPWGGEHALWAPLSILGTSAEMLAWPDDQALFRPIGVQLGAGSPSVLWGFGTLAALLLIRFAAIRFRSAALSRSSSLALLTLGSLALAGPWLPVYPVFDNHLYLALAGFALLIASAIELLPRIVAPAVGLVLLGFAGSTTLRFVSTWSDNVTLLKNAAESASNSPHAQWVYAYALIESYGLYGDEQSLHSANEVIEKTQDLLDRSKDAGSDVFATPLDFLNTNLALGGCMLALAELEGYDDYRTPLDVFRAVVDARPDNVEARIGVGISARGLGDLELSESAFREALEVDANSAEAHRKLASLLMLGERWKEAQEHFERAAIIDPLDVETHIWLARSLLQQGWIERAEEQASRAHYLEPLFPEPMILLGILQLKRGNPSKALVWIDRALKSDPVNAFARIQRGYAFQAKNEIQNAMVEFKRATELLPDSFEAFYSLGNSLLQMKQAEVAAEAFKHAYRLHSPPEDREPLRIALVEQFSGAAHIQFQYAGVDFLRGDYQFARFWVNLALESDSRNGGALHLDGVLARLENDPERAISAFVAAAVEVPDSFQIFHDLGYLLIELDRSFEAVPHLRRALELVPATPQSPGVSERLREKLEASLAEIRGG